LSLDLVLLSLYLPAASASTTVESAATVITTTAVERFIAVESAACVTSCRRSAISIAIVASVAVSITTAIVTIPGTPIKAAPVIAVIPGTCSDEHAVREVARPVKPIRGARIRIISVISIGADRSHANAHRTYSDSNADAHLGVRVRSGKNQYSQ
jgi:hypothetical protein